MTEPVTTQKAPYALDVVEGRNYAWCACGLTRKENAQCDGSHKETDLKPVKFVAEKTGTVYLCGCRHTKKPPFCDGSHADLD